MDKNKLLMIVLIVIGVITFLATGFIGSLATSIAALGFLLELCNVRIVSKILMIIGAIGAIYGLYQMIMHFAGALM